jgi:hypothetical protein
MGEWNRLVVILGNEKVAGLGTCYERG